MTDTRPAWVMDIGDGVTVAAGTAHVAEYLLAAEPMTVPRTPAHCAGMMVWRERLIPVIDVGRLLTGRSTPSPHRHAVILAYQQAAGRPLQYGAMLVAGAPTQTSVSDDMACALPDTQPALSHIARACFSHQDRAVAILDPRRLFDSPLPTTPAPEADVEPAMIGHDTRDRAPVVSPDSVSVRRHERMPVDVAPYLRVVAPATPVAIEPAVPVAADHGGDPSPPALPEPEAAETIDIEWPAAFETVTETMSADTGDELPVMEDTSLAADIAPPAAAQPDVTTGARTGTDADAATGRTASNTVRSFERLHDLKRRHTPTVRRDWRWLLAGAAALLALLIGIWSLTGPDKTAAPPAAMVQDAASLAVHPASVPSTPAQPPK